MHIWKQFVDCVWWTCDMELHDGAEITIVFFSDVLFGVGKIQSLTCYCSVAYLLNHTFSK